MRERTWMTLGLMLGLVACTKEAPGLGGGGNAGNAGTGGIGSTANALISGRVFDTQTNSPVRGATVKTPSGMTVTTDSDGMFQVEADPGKVVLTVEETDHAKGVKEVDAYQDAESYVELFAKPTNKQTLDAQTGGMTKVGEMSVVLPADSLETEDGDPYTGDVTVEVATVRPDKANELSAFPGKFDGTTVDDQAGSVATRAAASIRLLSPLGQPLRMRGTARIEVFLPVRSALSQNITRLWKLREASADWEEVGFPAVRQPDPIDGTPALRTAIAALTWWNAGDPFVKSRIRGCLQLPDVSGGGGSVRDASVSTPEPGGSDDGAGDPQGFDAGVPRMQAPLIGDNPLAGIQVVARGIGYGYFVEKYTDDEGCFELEGKALAPVAIFAQSRSKRSAPTRVVAPAPGMMRDLGTIMLVDRDNACPGAMTECEGTCVDILSDDANCGTCGNACSGEPSSEYPTVVPIHCTYGTCGCDDNQEECGGGCANVETDSQNCGGCGSVYACNVGDECANGSCVPMTCPTGEVACDGACVPADPGCGVVALCIDASDGSACPSLSAASTTNGFETCCNPDGHCGIATDDADPHVFSNPCASTEYNRPETPECPSGFIDLLSLSGMGCCRSDGNCGMVIEGGSDLGCILLSDLSAETYPDPIRCTGTAGADAGIRGDAGVQLPPDGGL